MLCNYYPMLLLSLALHYFPLLHSTGLCEVSPRSPTSFVPNRSLMAMSFRISQTFCVPCPHNLSMAPLFLFRERCWKTSFSEPYGSLLYAPGVIVTWPSYPAASHRTAPSSRTKRALSATRSGIRLVFALASHLSSIMALERPTADPYYLLHP